MNGVGAAGVHSTAMRHYIINSSPVIKHVLFTKIKSSGVPACDSANNISTKVLSLDVQLLPLTII